MVAPARGETWPVEVKARVLAAVAAGESINKASEQAGVPRTTVIDWVHQTRPVRIDMSDSKKAEFEELFAKAVTSGLCAFVAGASQILDAEWRSKQNAADLAILVGVVFDKASRVAAAFGEREESD